MSLLSPRLVVLFVLAAAAASVAAISAGTLKGKGAGGDPAAQQVIDRALNNSNFHSGRFKASFNAHLEGASVPPQLANAINANLSGAFNDRGTGKSPELDMTMSMNVGHNVQFRAISTGKQGFVGIAGRMYKATPADFQRMYGQIGRPEEQLGLAGLGAQPRSWMRDATNQGTASIGGETTNHVSAKLDLDKMTDDIAALSSKYRQPGGPEVSSQDAKKFKDAVHGGQLDVFASSKDGTLRKATLHIDMKFDDGSGALDFAIDFSDVNKPQRIEVPRSALPFSRVEADLASGALSPFSAGASSTGTETVPAPDSGVAAPAVPAETQGYLGCVEKAGSEAELQRCSSLLP